MAIKTLSNPIFISIDNAGQPNSAGTVEVYTADGLFTTLAILYSDQIRTSELSNPVTLDADGTKEIWYDVKVDIKEKKSDGVLIRDTLNIDPNAGNAVVQSFNLASNGSFEVDSTNDGQPDSWTIKPYDGSAIAITNDVVTNGVEALEFNTGSAVTGGGTATSAKFPVTEGTTCSVSFSFFATSADTTNTFTINWYDEDNVLLTPTVVTMPATGSVPASWTNYQQEVTVAATGTQGEIVLVGINSSSTAPSASAYFDGISILNDTSLVTLGTAQTIVGVKTMTAPLLTLPILTAPTATNLISNGVATGTAIGRGCLVHLSGAETITTATYTHISWDDETNGYDTDSIHSTSSANQRLTVPAGVTKIRLTGQIAWEVSASGYLRAVISKNDETTAPAVARGTAETTVTTISGVAVTQQVVSSIIDVVATDYFTLAVYHTLGSDLDVNVNNSWFAMEIIK